MKSALHNIINSVQFNSKGVEHQNILFFGVSLVSQHNYGKLLMSKLTFRRQYSRYLKRLETYRFFLFPFHIFNRASTERVLIVSLSDGIACALHRRRVVDSCVSIIRRTILSLKPKCQNERGGINSCVSLRLHKY